MDNRPVIFGAQHLNKALIDPEFFSMLPEFLTIKSKMETMKINAKSSVGCTPCKMRRIRNTVNSDFLSILSSLSKDGKDRFKKYFGAERMMFHMTDPKTYDVKLIEL